MNVCVSVISNFKVIFGLNVLIYFRPAKGNFVLSDHCVLFPFIVKLILQRNNSPFKCIVKDYLYI